MTYAELEKERQRLLPTYDHKYFMLIAPPPTWKHWSRVVGHAIQEELPIDPSLVSSRNDLDLFFFRREDTGMVLFGDMVQKVQLSYHGVPND